VSTRPPEFDDLVGPDVDAAERDRLRRVHDLLVDVGPPPELSQTSAPAIGGAPVTPLRRPSRRRRVALALAAALGVVAIFALGLVVASGDDPNAERVVAMTGASGASASLEIYEIDAAGNWPMLIDVRGLPPAGDGRLFELWLTQDGEPTALCGSFHTDDDGRAVVPMNAPWRLDEFDGWVVVAAGSTTPVLTT
jgi:Anti-sigma-K factor rskA